MIKYIHYDEIHPHLLQIKSFPSIMRQDVTSQFHLKHRQKKFHISINLIVLKNHRNRIIHTEKVFYDYEYEMNPYLFHYSSIKLEKFHAFMKR